MRLHTLEAITTIIMVEMDISITWGMVTIIIAIKITTTILREQIAIIMEETMAITAKMTSPKGTLARWSAFHVSRRDTIQETTLSRSNGTSPTRYRRDMLTMSTWRKSMIYFLLLNHAL
jgi:hypothetical protein